MSPFDSRKPSTGVEANGNQVQELTTVGGVKVIVGAEPPPRKRRRRQQEASPPTFVFPAGQSAEDREAFLEALRRQYGPFVDGMLRAQRDVGPESAQDLRQMALVILCDHVATTGEIPDNPEGFLVAVLKNLVSNHGRVKRAVPVGMPDSGALVDYRLDPEQAAARAELLEKLERYLGMLPPEEAEVVRLSGLEGMTLQEIAEAVGRPWTTVRDQLARARDKLQELAQASVRAAERRREASAAGPGPLRRP